MASVSTIRFRRHLADPIPAPYRQKRLFLGSDGVLKTIDDEGTVEELGADLTPATESEMEAGSETDLRSMSPTNIAQAINALAVTDLSGVPATLTLVADASNNVKGYGLTTIPNDWQSGASTLKGLSIGQGVTSIGSNAFRYCSGFTGSLTIPDSVTSIGSNAFYDCSGFTGSLTIPDSVTSIGSNAFRGCAGFTGSLTIPNSVTSIGSNAFGYCSGFTGSLTIPDSVTSIGDYAFGGCSGLTGSLTILNSVTSIGSNAFRNCSGFTGSLTIPDSVTSIGDYAFRNCSGFTGSLTIPDSVTSIGDYAFRGCSGLTGSLTIPNSVTSIGSYAFRNCSGLTNVNAYVEKSIVDGSNVLNATDITTIHARASDATWTASAGQTIGGKTGITVIKDL